MILSLTVAVLVTGGVYLLLQRSMVRAVFGMTLLSHAANFVLLAAGVPGWRAEPLTDLSARADMADPLPQAFVLTAIVITMAVTIFMLTLAVIGRDDDMSHHPATGENRDS
ncbi:sodium:proton antiporter [Brachybacterium sp. UNK5269]|uniref:sodium:proton antiporter n=1 Tax=Brachybacterium sp. UNK5269 TaxID=3408576 RepID=UPI003BB0E49C